MIERNFGQEVASPQTSFALSKVIQKLGNEMLENLEQTEPEYLEDQKRYNEREVYTSRRSKDFGDLKEWDGRFFSYARFNIPPMDPQLNGDDSNDAFLKIDFKPNNESFDDLPKGTFITLELGVSPHLAYEGAVFKRVVALQQESGPVVMDWVIDSLTPKEGHSWLRIDHWRSLGESEARDLLFDITDLNLRYQI